MQMQMKTFLFLFFSFLDSTKAPQPPLKETKESLVTVNKTAIEGHYLVTGPKYKSTAIIVRPAETQVYLVYQYSGPNVTKGIGFMDGDRFVIGWEQEKATGVTSIHFRDGKGRASWVSNPGNGVVGHETWSLIDDEK